MDWTIKSRTTQEIKREKKFEKMRTKNQDRAAWSVLDGKHIFSSFRASIFWS